MLVHVPWTPFSSSDALPKTAVPVVMHNTDGIYNNRVSRKLKGALYNVEIGKRPKRRWPDCRTPSKSGRRGKKKKNALLASVVAMYW